MHFDSILWFMLVVGFIALVAYFVWSVPVNVLPSNPLSNAAEQLGFTYEGGVYGKVDGLDIRVTHIQEERQGSVTRYRVFFPKPVNVGSSCREAISEFKTDMKTAKIRVIALDDKCIECYGPYWASSDEIVQNTRKILRFAQQLVAN